VPSPRKFERLLLVGLPRSGTTLLATLLGGQPGVHFLTDYFPAFTEALQRLGKAWTAELSNAERRIALALVRDQFLRVRHPVLVRLADFATLDELHQRVLAELGAESDHWVGHKLLLGPELLRRTLDETEIRCLVLFRDPRDAALSYFHRVGAGVERYVRNWSATVRLWHELRAHPRLLGLRFEDLLQEPSTVLGRLGDWLGHPLSPHVGELQFQRSHAHGKTPWSENSAFGDVQGRFDRQPLGRWRAQLDSPIVRYAAWATRETLPLLGYERPHHGPSARDRIRFGCLEALERSEQQAYTMLARAVRQLRKRIVRDGSF
jgi:hypothetical protein